MLTLVLQQFKQVVIIPCIRSFAAAALPEDKLILQRFFLLPESGGVNADAFFALFAATENDLVTLFQVAGLNDIQVTVFTDDHAGIHPAVFCQQPLAVHFEVFGEHRGAVIIFGSHTVQFCKSPDHIGCICQCGGRKIRGVILRHLEGHRENLSLYQSP